MNLLFYSLLILGCLVVIPVGHYGFHLPKLLLLSIAAAIGCLQTLRAPYFSSIWHTRSGQLWLGYSAVIALSAIWSIAPMASLFGLDPRFDGWLAHGIYAGLLITSLHQVRIPMLCRCIVVIGIVATLHGTLQMLSIDPLQTFWETESFLGRIFSLFGQPNAYAHILLITLPFIVWATTQTKGLAQAILCFMCLLAIVNLFGTASRASLLGGMVSAVICFAALPQSMQTLTKHRQTIVLVLVGLCICALVGQPLFQRRFTGSFEGGRSLGSRHVIAESTVSLIAKRPMGYGLETLLLTSGNTLPKKLYQFESLSTEIDRSHSKPLELLYTLGPLGLLTYYGFISCLCIALWKRRKHTLERTLLVSIAGLNTALVFEFETPPIHALSWVVLGLSLARISPESKKQTAAHAQRTIAGMGLLVALLSSLVSAQWLAARHTLHAAETDYLYGDTTRSLLRYEQSIVAFPFDRTSLVSGIEVTLVDFEQGRDVLSLQRAEEWLKALHTLTNHQDGTAYALEGWFHTLQSNPAEQALAFTKAKELKPTSVTVQRIIQYVYTQHGTAEQANRATQALIDLLPPGWNDEESERGRILRKEAPWVYNLQR